MLLARNRLPQPAVAAGVPFAAELISLPSGLLSMVCEAIVALKVSLGSVLRVRLGCMGVRGMLGGLHVVPDWMLFRFPMSPEPVPIPAVPARCVEARDYATRAPWPVPECAVHSFTRGDHLQNLRNSLNDAPPIGPASAACRGWPPGTTGRARRPPARVRRGLTYIY